MLEAKNIESPDEKYTFEHGEVQVVNLTGITVGRATFRPGWQWSTDVKPLVGTSSCQMAHSSYVVSGRFHVRMDDGSELELGPGDAHLVSPGHDAWVVGDEPCVAIDFSAGPEGASDAAPERQDEDAIRRVIEAYGDRLRTGDVAGIARLYTHDATVMAPDLATASGVAQISDVYKAALDACGMDYQLEFDAVQVSGDTAVARTRTTGATTVRASGAAVPGRNRELFVLRRAGEEWLISEYMFQAQPASA